MMRILFIFVLLNAAYAFPSFKELGGKLSSSSRSQAVAAVGTLTRSVGGDGTQTGIAGIGTGIAFDGIRSAADSGSNHGYVDAARRFKDNDGIGDMVNAGRDIFSLAKSDFSDAKSASKPSESQWWN